MTENIEYSSADGLKLFAKSYGPVDAPLSVLCMHGLTRNHQDFEPMIAALGDQYRFIAVDVRGRGRSAYDPDPTHYTPQVYIKDMEILLDHLGLKRVALVGTSMGGLMAMLMMKAMPARICGVVLNDIGPSVDKAGLKRIAGYVGKSGPIENWAEAADRLQNMQGPFFPALDADDWMAFARRTFRERDDGQVVLDYDPAIAASFGKGKISLWLRLLMWQLFKSMYASPLLVIRGQISDLFAEKTMSTMVRRHPDARAVTVPEVGHAPILDEPEAVAAIAEFLAYCEQDRQAS